MKWIKANIKTIVKILVLVVQTVISIVFIEELTRINLLPLGYIWLALSLLFFILAGEAALIFIPGKKPLSGRVRHIIGSILSVTLSLVLLFGAIAISRANATIDNISGNYQESNLVGVYVRADDAATEIKEAATYSYGIDNQFDVENAKATQAAIEEELGQVLKVSSYEKVTDMIDALLSKEIDAVIINTAYIDVLEDMSKYEDLDGQIKKIYQYEILAEADTQEVEDLGPITERSFIVYISGSDTRSETLATSRSDVNLLAVVNPVSKQLLLLNTPRDYYVLTSKSNYMERDKLTHCGVYGIDCSMDTLGYLYGIDVDYYAQINFEGFKDLVDAIGGITVDVDRAFTSVDDYQIGKGLQTLNGEYALAFVRERHAFADGDIQRGKNQMKAVKAILEKVKGSTSLLTNYGEVMKSLEGTFRTNISTDDISALVKMQIDNNVEWEITSFGVLGEGTKKTTYSMPDKKSYVMIPIDTEVAEAQALIDKVMRGQSLE